MGRRAISCKYMRALPERGLASPRILSLGGTSAPFRSLEHGLRVRGVFDRAPSVGQARVAATISAPSPRTPHGVSSTRRCTVRPT